MKKYGMTEKTIRMIRMFYKNYECAVAVEERETEMFKVKSGVRQM